MKNFLELSLEHISSKIKIFISQQNFIDFSPNSISNLIEIQKAIKTVFDRIYHFNNRYFTKKQLILQNCQISKLYTKVLDLIELKSLLNEIKKLIPDLSFLKENHKNIDETKQHL
jgi:hypothetical protein